MVEHQPLAVADSLGPVSTLALTFACSALDEQTLPFLALAIIQDFDDFHFPNNVFDHVVLVHAAPVSRGRYVHV